MDVVNDPLMEKLELALAGIVFLLSKLAAVLHALFQSAKLQSAKQTFERSEAEARLKNVKFETVQELSAFSKNLLCGYFSCSWV